MFMRIGQICLFRAGAQGCIRRGKARRPQRRLGRRLEEVTKAVWGGYCRLQMPVEGRQLASGGQ